ncbi:TcdA/TcdB catalytic glycosyltransferase domain-containing protein [Legionella sp. CNM-1927-20]|uniref:TcdA/TcdB catalytic glycosyltransferase domain-containing protein n=1 Tax=Legionella sp. CNM-1927-20 TaxID=3422221 RepID=UPI00403B0A5F
MQPASSLIPNIIHAVWLGKPPSADVLNNVRDWKITNSTFDVKLWIDSSTYTEEEKLKELPKLLEWAKENKVIICDISLPKEASKDNIVGEQELYSEMPGKQFFEDELSGEYRNLAAASDILRAEILYKQGGIYIDAKDMLPNAPIPQNFNLKFGFAFHDCGQNRLNNDLIASIPKGTIISEYRQLIIDNYKKLYQNNRLLDAHRNNSLRSPHLLSGGDTRYLTTLQTSGPGALSNMIEQLMRFLVLIPEANSPIYDSDESSLFMPNEIFNIPNHGSDVSWNDLTISYEKIKPYLFNYFCEYWSFKIAEEIGALDKSISNSNSGLSFVTNYFKKINPELYDARKILVDIKNNLDNLPRSLSPNDFFQTCVSSLDKKALKVFEDIQPDFWTRFQYSFAKFSSRFSLCEKEITDKDFQQALLHVSAKGADFSWKDFIALFVGLREAPEDISHLSELIQEISSKNLPSFRHI